MRKLILLFTAATIASIGATCTSTGSGAYATVGTWAACGGGVPSSGDTASIGNGHTITSTSAVTVGALTLSGTGTVTVTGGTFQVNGAITFDPNSYCAVYNPAITLSAGTTLKFDSVGPSSGGACRSIVANGTSVSHVTIAARASTATARLGGNIDWTYVDVSNITTFSVDEDYNGTARFKWNVTHSAFNNVGSVTQNGCCGLTPGGYFRHAWNVHTRSPDAALFASWYDNSGASLGSGTRDIVGNVFDKQFASSFPPAYFTIVGNYFGNASNWGGSTPAPNNVWARFDGNFVRFTGSWRDTASAMSIQGDIQNSVLSVDTDWNNQKPIILWNAGGAMSLRDLVVDNSGNGGTGDSGELWFNYSPSSSTTYGIYNTLMLCNMYGTSSYEIGAWGIFPNAIGAVEHNTWCGGYNGTASEIGHPGLQMGEGYTPIAGQLASVKSNIFWNPLTTGNVTPWAKMAQVGNNQNPTTNICSPANCDYNTGYGLGYHATEPSWTAYTNQAKGYVAKFSSPPGMHDVDVDPAFVDYKRSVPLFYTKYLGNSPAAWSSGASYSVGTIVSYTDAALYYGLPLAYRYQNSGSCASTNPQPGSGTNWRDCWEWATLRWMRDNVAANTLFDDPTIGVSQQDAIAAVWAWIRAGYSPTNSALAGAAHDGGDIGPMPVSFEILGDGGTPTPHVIRGSRIRGTVIK